MPKWLLQQTENPLFYVFTLFNSRLFRFPFWTNYIFEETPNARNGLVDGFHVQSFSEIRLA